MNSLAESLKLKIESSSIKADLITDTFYVESAQGSFPQYAFSLEVPDRLDESFIWTQMEIEYQLKVKHEKTEETVSHQFKGVVANFELDNIFLPQNSALKRYRYKIQLRPLIYEALKHHMAERIFTDKTVQEIIESLFKEHGFKNYHLNFEHLAKTQKFPFCMQHQESDLTFFLRLVKLAGLSFFFDSKGVLQVVDNSKGYVTPDKAYFEKPYCYEIEDKLPLHNRPSDQFIVLSQFISLNNIREKYISTVRSVVCDANSLDEPKKQLTSLSPENKLKKLSDAPHFGMTHMAQGNLSNKTQTKAIVDVLSKAAESQLKQISAEAPIGLFYPGQKITFSAEKDASKQLEKLYGDYVVTQSVFYFNPHTNTLGSKIELFPLQQTDLLCWLPSIDLAESSVTSKTFQVTVATSEGKLPDEAKSTRQLLDNHTKNSIHILFKIPGESAKTPVKAIVLTSPAFRSVPYAGQTAHATVSSWLGPVFVKDIHDHNLTDAHQTLNNFTTLIGDANGKYYNHVKLTDNPNQPDACVLDMSGPGGLTLNFGKKDEKSDYAFQLTVSGDGKNLTLKHGKSFTIQSDFEKTALFQFKNPKGDKVSKIVLSEEGIQLEATEAINIQAKDLKINLNNLLEAKVPHFIVTAKNELKLIGDALIDIMAKTKLALSGKSGIDLSSNGNINSKRGA